MSVIYRSERDPERCRNCGFCEQAIDCPGEQDCSGCGACVAACPYEAKRLVEVEGGRGTVEVRIDGRVLDAPDNISILQALERAGYEISWVPDQGQVSAPCRTGGCWTCAVLVNGKPKRACITPIRAGMSIQTSREAVSKFEPIRVISGFMPHGAGGVGTPASVKKESLFRHYIEVACFAHGCILRCPTCQNWTTAYGSRGSPLAPELAARMLTLQRHRYRVDRMAISGGESTLNRPWLLSFLDALKTQNPDPAARLHVDTNGVCLTPEYVDELIAAGMTDIGVDVKGLELATFMKITGLKDVELATTLWKNNWGAVHYLLREPRENTFVGIGIPYNRAFMSEEEVKALGARLASWRPDIQVTVLDYRPEFRRPDLEWPDTKEMIRVQRLLKRTGLRKVMCQTRMGTLGPSA